MIEHKQLIEHDPNKGQYGDCLKTAVASILDLPVEVVPDFNGSGFDWQSQNDEVREFAATLGLGFAAMMLKGSPESILKYMEVSFPGGQYLMSGKGSRGGYHTVVCEGGAFLHDPHPSNDFLIDDGTADQSVEVAFFVARNRPML